jgi:excisionase family DNA binding protein
MTIQEVAEYLQVPVQTIYKWNAMGTGPAYMRVGKYLRYRLREVDQWLAARHSSVLDP